MSPERHPSGFQNFIKAQVFAVIRATYGFEKDALAEIKGTKATEARGVAAYLFQESGIPKSTVGELLKRTPNGIEGSLREIGKTMKNDENFRGKVSELGERIDIIRLRRNFVKMRPDLI